MKFIIFLLAVFCLILSFGYFYKEELVIKIHAFLNLFLFNDSYVIHYRRRVGLIYFVVALFLFFLILNG